MAQRKRNIEFAPPDEPSFLKKLKNQIGYQNKAAETVDTKKSELEKAQKSDLTDREDEQPVFVVAEDSEITESELKAFQEKLKDDLEPINEIDTSQKIVFRKPTKEKGDSKGMQAVQSTSSRKDQTEPKDHQSSEAKKKNIKSVKNASLLSFNEDEEED